MFLELREHTVRSNPQYQKIKKGTKTRKGNFMEEFSSCKKAMEACAKTKTFALAHLFQEEKVMEMHIHDCYEIYYSISGGKQFLIDNKFYPIQPGDLFLINQYESHYISQLDKMVHERIVLSIHPDYVKHLSSKETDLDACFSSRPPQFQHRFSLNKDQQARFLYYINKLKSVHGYGSDILEQAFFMELLVMLNAICTAGTPAGSSDSAAVSATPPAAIPSTSVYNQQVDAILAYINQNLSSALTIEQLAAHFFLSESYICRIFKAATGTTINKYITARRISIAKAHLSGGASVNEAWEQSGFADYSNFLRAFTKAVGVSPKKYAQYSVS